MNDNFETLNSVNNIMQSAVEMVIWIKDRAFAAIGGMMASAFTSTYNAITAVWIMALSSVLLIPLAVWWLMRASLWAIGIAFAFALNTLVSPFSLVKLAWYFPARATMILVASTLLYSVLPLIGALILLILYVAFLVFATHRDVRSAIRKLWPVESADDMAQRVRADALIHQAHISRLLREADNKAELAQAGAHWSASNNSEWMEAVGEVERYAKAMSEARSASRAALVNLNEIKARGEEV